MKLLTIPVGMLGTNCYILASEEKNCVTIDPGAQPERLAGEITKNGWNLRHILLTHGHHDHIGGVKKLMEAFPEADLYIGEGDAEMLADSSKSLAAFRYDDDGDFLLKNVKTLKEGDTIALDELTFQVLETPGHTKGGVCYLCADQIFAGDTLFAGDVGRTDLYGGDYQQLKASLAKLAALKGNYKVYPGHGDSTTLEEERRNNPYVNGRL
ncbi:MBL fold metallo-hydrolase [Oscillospiraceae bacterium MB08-C2-2]|nr:MBL fold metallo-hydrolase [Oscillospiraceae bacterium MB08-C2-2]